MPLPREELDRIGAERLAAQLEADRHRRRLWLKTAVLCVLWPLVGLSLIAWSFHTTDSFYGQIAFWAGLAVGDGATLATIVLAWARAARKGWI